MNDHACHNFCHSKYSHPASFYIDTKKAMLEFSYQLTVGNLDAAFKSVRAIDNSSVWENMARMCVTNKRVDVAAVCMGKLGNAASARVLREASNEREVCSHRDAWGSIKMSFHEPFISI